MIRVASLLLLLVVAVAPSPAATQEADPGSSLAGLLSWNQVDEAALRLRVRELLAAAPPWHPDRPLDTSGRTLLMVAAERGHVGLVDDLLAAGASAAGVDRSGTDALMQTADPEVVRRLLAAGAPVGRTNPAGWTAADIAAWNGRAAVVAALVAAGAPPPRDSAPLRAVQSAAKGPGDRALAALARDAAIFSMQDPLGNTPLHVAAAAGNATAIAWLLARGAAPDVENLGGLTPLAYVAYTPHAPNATQEGTSVAIIEALITGGADPNHRSRGGSWPGMTPLHAAAVFARADVVNALLRHGARSDATDETGRTALHLAIHPHQLPVVRRLIAASADPTARDAQGDTPIMLAGRAGNRDVVQAMRGLATEP